MPVVAHNACCLKCAIFTDRIFTRFYPIFTHFRTCRSREPSDSGASPYSKIMHHSDSCGAFTRESYKSFERARPKRCVVPDSEMCIMLILDTLAAAFGSRPCRQERAHRGDHADMRGSPYGQLCEPQGTKTLCCPRFRNVHYAHSAHTGRGTRLAILPPRKGTLR